MAIRDSKARLPQSSYDEHRPVSAAPSVAATDVEPTQARDTAALPVASWRTLVCAAALLPVFVASYYLAFWLRFEGQFDAVDWYRFTATVYWAVAIKLVLFGWFGVYQGWGRHATFDDLLALIKATTASSLVTAAGAYLLFTAHTAPRSVFLLDWGASVVLIGGLRMLPRVALERGRFWFRTAGQVPALIVGANDAGEALLRAIRRNPKLGYHVVGFADERGDRVGSRIGGVKVLTTVEHVCPLARARGIGDVLIVAGGLPGREVRELVRQGERHGVRVKVLPSYEQLIDGSLAIRPRAVSIEDLLRRDSVRLDRERIGHWVDGRVLLVTGSAGSIGSEIAEQLLRFAPRRLVLVDRSENGQFFLERKLRSLRVDVPIECVIADIGDAARMRRLLEQHRPEIIFHAAAYKHVPLMESNPGEAVKNIVLATRNLADLASQQGVDALVMISTDKAVNPTSVMGACKRAAERYVQSLAGDSPCRFITVRFGNVLDSEGSVVRIFREQIARGGPVTVTDPRMQRYFMTIPEAAGLVIQAGAMGAGGEIFVLDMGEPVRIVDLAADMIRLSGLRVGEDVDIQFIGIRPGEKLFEELRGRGESYLPTRHAKILVAVGEPGERATLRRELDRLDALTEAPPEELIEQLRALVPDYHRPEVHHFRVRVDAAGSRGRPRITPAQEVPEAARPAHPQSP